MSVAAILLCGGKGERLGIGEPKALVPLAGRPLFTWSLETFERAATIDAVVVVGSVKKLQAALALAAIPCGKVVAWCEGGRERQDSVANGLQALPAGFDLVAIHDAARALVSAELIARVIGDALERGAAIAAVPLDDTLKRATLRTVDATVPRANLWRAQTPQVFRRDWLETAHREVRGKATDDAALVEACGHPVQLTPGEALNFKITTREDLELAEACLLHRAART